MLDKNLATSNANALQAFCYREVVGSMLALGGIFSQEKFVPGTAGFPLSSLPLLFLLSWDDMTLKKR